MKHWQKRPPSTCILLEDVVVQNDLCPCRKLHSSTWCNWHRLGVPAFWKNVRFSFFRFFYMIIIMKITSRNCWRVRFHSAERLLNDALLASNRSKIPCTVSAWNFCIPKMPNDIKNVNFVNLRKFFLTIYNLNEKKSIFLVCMVYRF